jgi:hypothetical protein
MWLCVDIASTDVSEERIASIFRVKNPRTANQRQQVAADKRRLAQYLHSPTSQKTFFIVTAVKNLNLTIITFFVEIIIKIINHY